MGGEDSAWAKYADALRKISFAPFQLTILLLERLDPRRLLGGDTRLHAGIDLGLLHPGPQRLDTDAELIGDPLDRALIGARPCEADAPLGPPGPSQPANTGACSASQATSHVA